MPEARRPPAGGSRQPEALTLARAFELMRRALAELPSPASNEALRIRMAALHGKEDPMLEAAAFPRLLRQAHDAEIADVRKVSDDEYEVVGRGVEPTTAALSRGGDREAPPPAEPETAMATLSAADASAQRGGIRFRRGSRIGAPPPVIPMIGIVSLDEERPEQAKKPRAGKKAAKPASEAPATVTKKRSAPRGKKKVEG